MSYSGIQKIAPLSAEDRLVRELQNNAPYSSGKFSGTMPQPTAPSDLSTLGVKPEVKTDVKTEVKPEQKGSGINESYYPVAPYGFSWGTFRNYQYSHLV